MTTKPESGAGDPRPGVTDQTGGVDDADIAIEVEVPAVEVPVATAEAAGPVGPEQRVAQLEARVAELEAKDKDTYDRLLRTTADLDNFRKRTRRELDQARSEARSRTLMEMLPVVDNLERAVAHADQAVDAKGIADGVNLVLRQFGQALERLGVTPLDAVGKPFDPNVHEAVSQLESAEHAPGTVVAELQKGYMIGDRLLRPTLAVVSTAPPAAEEEAAGPNGHDKSADPGEGQTGGES